jgi:hypothetical protein
MRIFVGGLLQILEQNKMMKNMMNIAHKLQSVCGHTNSAVPDILWALGQK